MKKKKKYNLGGPLNPPKDTVRVEPIKPLPVITQTRATIKGNDGETSSKNKSSSRFREKSFGGDLLQTGISFIPGVGQILAPLVGMVDQKIDENSQQTKPDPPVNLNMNPFGKLAMGGIVNDNFKQYNTGSHASGNDLPIDSNGDPNANGQNSVQNKENAYQINGKPYVFSDVLTKDGIPFNQHAMKINKKYPKARFQQDQRQTLDFEMEKLSKENDIERSKVEQKATKQLALGGGPDDPNVPASDNLAWAAVPNQDLYPSTKNFVVPTLDTLPTITEQKYGMQKTPGMLEAEQMGTSTATDNTSFGTELAPVGTNLSEPGAQVEDRGNPLAAKDLAKSGILDAKTANTIGLASKGFALAGSIADALSPAEKEKLITPDYKKADNYMQSANIDYTQAKQDAQGVSNIAAGTNRSLSSNAASYQGREQARLAGLSDQLGRIAEAQNNAQSSLNLTKGQYEAGKAVDTANRQYQNQQGNMQNQANSRFFDRTLASDLSQIGSSFNKYGETQKMIQNQKEVNQFATSQTLAILGSKYPNFKLNPDTVEQFKAGKITLDEFLQFVPDEVQKEVKTKVKTGN